MHPRYRGTETLTRRENYFIHLRPDNALHSPGPPRFSAIGDRNLTRRNIEYLLNEMINEQKINGYVTGTLYH